MAGYPGRHSYDQFYKRYRVLAPSAGRDAASPQDSCKDLVAALSLNKRHYQFGVTKLFLKGGQVCLQATHTHTHTHSPMECSS
jgi:myosin heavy subunit